MPSNNNFHANGKLLLSGEYFVLNGALALGLPTRMGQQMTVKESSGSDIMWESYLPNGDLWFKGKFDLFGFDPIKVTDTEIGNRLKDLLCSAVRLNSEFLSKWKKYKVTTKLDFDKDWGLGSSSTLISCIAQWADVDALELQAKTFGGSGYDVACANAKGPIYYRLDENEQGLIEDCPFDPAFKEQLYFVYLGKKQNSATSVAEHRNKKITDKAIDEISLISKSLTSSSDLKDFESLLVEHEQIVSSNLKLERQQDKHFSDYWGTIKSLGAWGGDFVLVTSNREAEATRKYFEQKGLGTVVSYQDMVLGTEI